MVPRGHDLAVSAQGRPPAAPSAIPRGCIQVAAAVRASGRFRHGAGVGARDRPGDQAVAPVQRRSIAFARKRHSDRRLVHDLGVVGANDRISDETADTQSGGAGRRGQIVSGALDLRGPRSPSEHVRHDRRRALARNLTVRIGDVQRAEAFTVCEGVRAARTSKPPRFCRRFAPRTAQGAPSSWTPDGRTIDAATAQALDRWHETPKKPLQNAESRRGDSNPGPLHYE